MAEFRAVRAMGHVLRTMFGNLGYAIWLSWPWMAILAALKLVPMFLFPGLWMVSSLPGSGGGTELDARTFALLSVAWTVRTFAFASIAVNWHRFILLGEQSGYRLRVDWSIWRYVGNGLLLLLIVGGSLTLFWLAWLGGLSVLAPDANGKWRFFFVVVLSLLVLVLVIAVIVQRLSIKFPAIALGRQDYGFGDAWRDSKGANLSLLGFTLMAVVLTVVSGMFNVLLVVSVGHELAMGNLFVQIVFVMLHVIGTWFGTILWVNALTTLYGIFAEAREV